MNGDVGTYVRMSADGLDGLLVKVTGVAEDATGDVVCVLETVKDVGSDGELGALLQLHAVGLGLCVDALDPVVVGLCVLMLHVLLEDNHVAVGNGLGLCRRQNGGCVVVDGASLEHGRGRGQRRQHSVGVLHGGCGGGGVSRGECSVEKEWWAKTEEGRSCADVWGKWSEGGGVEEADDWR